MTGASPHLAPRKGWCIVKKCSLGVSTETIREEIRNAVFSSEKSQISAKNLARKLGVSEGRVLRVARSTLEIKSEMHLRMGTNYATSKGLRRHYGLNKMQVANVLRKKRHLIRTIVIPTYRHPLGEVFYKVEDFFLVAPKLRYEYEKRNKRKSDSLISLRSKPDDLTEGEFATFRALIVVSLRRERVSYSELNVRFGLAGSDETVRRWIRTLVRKGYLDCRRRSSGSRINEYRFLKVDGVMSRLLEQVDSNLTKSFESD